MFFLLLGETNSTKAKGGNRDVTERYYTHEGDMRKIRHSRPGYVLSCTLCFYFPTKMLHLNAPFLSFSLNFLRIVSVLHHRLLFFR